MLPLVIIHPIKTGSLANGCGSISGRVLHAIVIERHRVIRRLVVLFLSLPPIVGGLLFI
jgi:hypothetical protein